MALYDRIGVGYDDRRRADPGIVALLAEQLLPESGSHYLDLACGTGNYTRALASHGGDWTGVDASRQMLSAARQRSRGAHLVHGDAHALPFPDASFDGIVCTLAIHHFGDRVRAFAEARRVLRSGRLIAFACEAGRTARYWLRAYFPEMFSRIAETEPDEDEMVADLHTAGFSEIEVQPYSVSPDLQDHFLYAGKHRPWLYLEPAVRAGISSFANLCEPSEVATGLARLREDLDSGRFHAIAAEHPSRDGDYVFIRASPRRGAQEPLLSRQR